ncbi:MAG: hypothetical protein ACQKBW_06645 [Puniceicoccales bacterium]
MKRILCLIAIVSCAIASTQAALITYTFTGAANVVGSNLQPDLQVGDTYTLTAIVDGDATNEAFVGTEGLYAAQSITATVATSGVGSFVVNFGNPYIQIENPGSYQRLSFISSPPSFSASLGDNDLFNSTLTLFSTGTPISGVSLPTSLNLADFSSNTSSTNWQIYFDSGVAADNARFNVGTASAAIPEPEVALPVALLGIAAILYRRRLRA